MSTKMTSPRHNSMFMWILIIAMLAVPSASKKDQLYHQLSSGIDTKEERIIGGSFVSCCVVYFLHCNDAD